MVQIGKNVTGHFKEWQETKKAKLETDPLPKKRQQIWNYRKYVLKANDRSAERMLNRMRWSKEVFVLAYSGIAEC